MLPAVQETADRLIADWAAKGYEQRGPWMPYNLTDHPNTFGWITTINNGSQQFTVWLPNSCDQYNLFDWSKSEVLDLP